MIEVVKNVLASLLLLSPVVLVLFKKRVPTALKIALGEIMVICRIVEPLAPPRARMLISGLGVGCFLIFFPAFLADVKLQSNSEQESLVFATGMALALALSILFRTLGLGTDLSTYHWFQGIGWIMAIAAAVMILTLQGRNADESPVRRSASGMGRITGLSLGIVGIIALIYLTFSSPTVIARWTEANHAMITGMLAVLTALFILSIVLRPSLVNYIPRWSILLWNGAFVLALCFTIFAHKTAFPPNESLYPIVAPVTKGFQQIPLFLMLLLFPIIFIDLILLIRELMKSSPSMRRLGTGFAISSLYFLLLIFAVIFTLISDYLPGIGPIFRDKIDLVFLTGGLAATAPVLLVKWDKQFSRMPNFQGKTSVVIILVAAAICVGTISAVLVTEQEPPIPSDKMDKVKVLTYNIQAGYDSSGDLNFDGQLEVLREELPDIIGLQESDTCRISGGNADIVRFLANRLNYFSYFGPKTVTGTFGIALLSKWPIENPITFYMFSEGEQTATIQAQINVGPTLYHVFVTHLGNFGPIEQQENILERIKGKQNVILMGDFNFARDTEQYAITTSVLDDAFLVAEDLADTRGIHGERIDHIFVSPGTRVTRYVQVGGDNSDHPAVMATIREGS
jgi:endonuclease/exonuclease/phosphatase family metal-dependent hydrolase/MFS family permease